MTNVPLDSLNRRYPNMYPDQLNQLNNQMGNLNITQGGFNKLWVFIFIDVEYIMHIIQYMCMCFKMSLTFFRVWNR